MYRIEILEKQLMASNTGRQIRDLVKLHVEEVMTLINNNRKVKVIWHRNKGPEFISKAVKSGIEKDFQVPDEIEGVHKTTLLRRVAAAIQENGSPTLRNLIGQYTTTVLNWSMRCNSLSQLFEEIKQLEGSNHSPFSNNQ